jgi:hypothetical protein
VTIEGIIMGLMVNVDLTVKKLKLYVEIILLKVEKNVIMVLETEFELVQIDVLSLLLQFVEMVKKKLEKNVTMVQGTEKQIAFVEQTVKK